MGWGCRKVRRTVLPAPCGDASSAHLLLEPADVLLAAAQPLREAAVRLRVAVQLAAHVHSRASDRRRPAR
jgi:hypothetical protein